MRSGIDKLGSMVQKPWFQRFPDWEHEVRIRCIGKIEKTQYSNEDKPSKKEQFIKYAMVNDMVRFDSVFTAVRIYLASSKE